MRRSSSTTPRVCCDAATVARNGVGMRGCSRESPGEAHHGSHAWIFVGDNSMGTESLDGRPEHTDALAPHIEGTWHYQISGSEIAAGPRARIMELPS